jgi:hypothetical protein
MKMTLVDLVSQRKTHAIKGTHQFVFAPFQTQYKIAEEQDTSLTHLEVAAMVRIWEHAQPHSEVQVAVAQEFGGGQARGQVGNRLCRAGSPPSAARRGHCRAS